MGDMVNRPGFYAMSTSIKENNLAVENSWKAFANVQTPETYGITLSSMRNYRTFQSEFKDYIIHTLNLLHIIIHKLIFYIVYCIYLKKNYVLLVTLFLRLLDKTLSSK